MDNTEYIESFFKSDPNAEAKEAFEKKIMENESFAEEVAFYISVNNTLREGLNEEKKVRFREIYNEEKVISMKPRVRNMWRYAAAACVALAVILTTWFISFNKSSPQQLADRYIQQNFQTLEVTMGTGDSLQNGLRLFNNNKLSEALVMFETIVNNNPANDEAKKYSGIVSLRLKNYDKALEYFSKLEADTTLYSNYGKFYKAVTLLARNKDGDKDAAKLLLEKVRDDNLEGKSDAGDWLKKFW